MRVFSNYETVYADFLSSDIKLNKKDDVLILINKPLETDLLNAIANRVRSLKVVIPEHRKGFWLLAQWPSNLDVYLRQRKTATMSFSVMPLTPGQVHMILEEVCAS